MAMWAIRYTGTVPYVRRSNYQCTHSKVFYGAKDEKAGSCGPIINLFELPYNHKPELIGGIMEEECSNILKEFFQALRLKRQLSQMEIAQN